MKNLLVFDLDGTLIDSRRDLATGVNLMREYYGLQPLDYKTVTGYVGNGLRKLVQRSLCDAGHICLDDALRIMMMFYQDHLIDETSLYPDVLNSLNELKNRGHKLAVLTNKAESLTLIILKELGIFELFDFVIGDGPTFPLKPDPAGLNDMIEKSGIEKSNCWMIGDHYTDMLVANNAGISTVFCEYGIGVTGEFEPTRRINGFAELTDFFN